MNTKINAFMVDTDMFTMMNANTAELEDMLDEIDENALNEAAWEFVSKWNEVIETEPMSPKQFNALKALLRPVIIKYLSEEKQCQNTP